MSKSKRHVEDRVKYHHCSKEFIQPHGARSNASQVIELQDHDGQVRISQAAMLQICTNYYSKLYTAKESPEATFGAQNVIMCYVEDKLALSTKNKLQAPMFASELQAAVLYMQPDKSQGLDGIVMEFYRIF